MASRPLFLCLLCTIAALGSVQVAGVGVGLEVTKTVNATEGDPLVLPCAPAGGSPERTVTVSWMVNGSVVVPNDRVSIQPNGSLAFTRIVRQPPHKSDQGLYKCQLRDSDGASLYSQTFSLIINGVDLGLEFARQPAKTVIASKGKPLVLACAPGGNSPEGTVTVSWLVNGSPLEPNERVFIQPNGSLSFKESVQESDQGLYQCKLTGSDGASLLSQTSSLRVAGMAAKFTQSPKNLSVETGDSARLSCHIEAVPTPVVLWERGGKTLPQDHRYQVLPSGVLLIDTVQASDAGSYRCVATTKKNKRVSTDAHLEVVPASKIFRPVEILADSNVVDIQVHTGEALFLECGASGYPVPSLRWSTQPPGQEELSLEMAPRLGTNVLLIQNISVQYTGVYICKATNVDAQNKEHFAQIRYNVSVLVAPRIKTPPQSLMYPIAKTVKFECEIDGVPKPNVTWYKNGELLHINGRIKQKVLALYLSNTVKEDSGIYQCRGWNEAGEVWAAARLIEQVGKQKTKASHVTGLTCSNITTSSISFTWDAVPGNVTAYTLHYFPTNGGDERQDVSIENAFTVHRLEPYTNYTFYVRAYTKNYAGEPSKNIICRTGEGRPSVAPQIIMQPISPTSVKVAWKKLKPHEARGIITTHKVQYRVVGTRTAWFDEVPAHVYNYTIRDLTPGVGYDVRVLSGTKAGWPELKAEQDIWWSIEMPNANDTVPLAPEVEVKGINKVAIKASWTMSRRNRIQPSKYRITLLKNEILFKGPLDVDSSTSSYVFDNIDPQDSLMVQVQALNEEGEAGGSGFKVFQPDQPEDSEGSHPPWSLDAAATSPNAIKLSWEGSSDGFFSISCQSLASESAILINSSKHSVLISDLKPHTTYKLSVRMFDKNLNLGPSSQIIECQTLEDVPGPPANLMFAQTNLTAGKVSWSPPVESNGQLRSYRIYYTLEENVGKPLDEWLQVSANQTFAEITGLTHSSYQLTVKASTQAGYGKAADFMPIRLLSNEIYSSDKTTSNPTSRYTILLAILCGTAAVLIIIGMVVTLRLAKSSVLRSPNHDLPQTNGNGMHHTEGIDMIALSSCSNIPPASPAHLDTKGWYPTPKANGAHSNGRVPNGISTPLLNQVHITENPQFNSHGDGKNACPSCPGPGCNSRGCPSCQVEPLLAADVTQVTVLAED
ncbi:protogenin-like [Neocloeon triangulifer]|uniref:protogenin-like n=1 Tax=Neocloeon triangulifer TaxID=2078957 RepID=UPI00286F243F|nr:protogenin-like [Neocloeon triangulifer]